MTVSYLSAGTIGPSTIAQRMHVAQPGVSAQVRRLERELEQELLDRSGRSVRPTQARRDGIDSQVLVDEPLVAAVSLSDPLTARATVRVGDLHERPPISLPRGPAYVRVWTTRAPRPVSRHASRSRPTRRRCSLSSSGSRSRSAVSRGPSRVDE
jgi:DNA-binding transcriptional LysR family regulator